MKTKKFSFSKDGIKNLFFRHIEKMFFVLACSLILVFVWFGFKTPIFDSITPREMLTKTEQADTYIHDDSHWNKLQEHRVADTDAASRIKDSKAVDPNTYSFRHIFGTAVFTLAPRRDPALVPVKDFQTRYLRAQVAKIVKKTEEPQLQLAGINSLPESTVLTFPPDQRMEMFTYRTDKLGSNIELQTVNAVVGMALIDHEQQLTNYRENFQYQRGYDAARDTPEYVFIEVERKTDDSDWQPITAHIYEVTPKYLAPAAKELANDDYVIPTLALPIPPFLGMDYRQFSLLDEIPTRDVFADDDRQKKRDRDDKKDDGSEDDPWGNNDDGSEAGDDDNEPKTAMTEEEAKEKVIPYRLVRFYDLLPKKTGTTYYYRLRVWIKDPNNPIAVNADIAGELGDKKKESGLGIGGGVGGGGGLADGGPSGGDNSKGKEVKEKKPLSEFDLAKEVRDRIHSDEIEVPSDLDDTEKDLYRLARPTEWVEATNPVTITSGFETFVAGPVVAPPIIQFGGGVFTATEPSIKIVANSFQDDLGVFVPAETETMRGSLLNYDAVTNLLDPISWTIKEVFDSIDSRKQKRGRHFQTDAVVLDIMGGYRQPFSRGKDIFFAPGECLIMDRNGQIHLHSDIEDATAYRHANFVSEDNTFAIEEASGRGRKDDDDDDSGGSN